MHSGRHFLQIPGPTNVPDRVLRAMDRPVIDHRSAEFAALGKEVLGGMRSIFQTSSPVIIYPGSGTGAWEAAIVNTLSPGDGVLLFETGHFSQLWRQVIEKFGVHVDYVPGSWRRGANPAELEARLGADRAWRSGRRRAARRCWDWRRPAPAAGCRGVAGSRCDPGPAATTTSASGMGGSLR